MITIALLAACATTQVLVVTQGLAVVPGIVRLSPSSQSSGAGLAADPVLRVDPGTHTASIISTAIDRSGRWLATASSDKTIRLWSVASGQLEKVLRVPIGPGQIGDVARVAVSPDGSLIAASWRSETVAAIFVFGRSSGGVQVRIDGLLDAITDIAFSPNGRWLAATVVSGGVQVYDTSNWRERSRDAAYGGESDSVEFSADGKRLLTTCLDGFLRLYSVEASGDLRELARADATQTWPETRRPQTARFSPDGRLIAVAFDHRGGVEIWSATDLARRSRVDTGDVISNIASLAWSPDGLALYAPGVWTNENRIRRWSAAPGLAAEGPFNPHSTSLDVPLTDHGSVVAPIRALPDGSVLVATTGPSWGVVSPTGAIDWRHAPSPVRASRAITSSANPAENLRLSADARRVSIDFYGSGRPPRMFDLQQRVFGDPESDLAGPRTSAPGVTIQKDHATVPQLPSPVLNGHSLAYDPNERTSSLAISPDGRLVAFGTIFSVRLYDLSGRLLWRQPGWVEAVNVSPDGRWVVADMISGAIVWFRIADGRETLSLYPHPDGRRWVIWTPSGFYDTSVGGESLVGWHVNRGTNQAADFYPVSRFRARFYRPDVVARILETGDELQALRLADAQAGKLATPGLAPILKSLPPTISVLSPIDGDTVSAREVRLQVSISAPPDAPATAISARVNGLPVNLGGKRALAIPPAASSTREISLPVPAADSAIQIFAENRNGTSVPAVLRLAWRGAVAPTSPLKPTLYLLAIGVSKYANPDYRLNLAAKDAEDFARVMRTHSQALYGRVEVKLLTDGEANRANVLAGLAWLRAKAGSPQDVGVVFLSGHGVTDADGAYAYLPVDTDAQRLAATTVDGDAIRDTLAALPGRAIFFVDTCHAGAVLNGHSTTADMTRLTNELTDPERSVVVLSSSSPRQFAYEKKEWGNGAFTTALLEGVGGRADLRKSGQVTVKGLDFYLSERVPELTQKQQTPMTISPSGFIDFPLAGVK